MHLLGWLLVLICLQVPPGLAQGGVFPWKAGDAAPLVAGIHLGDDRARFETVLGKPSDTQKLGEVGLALTYRQRGVQVLYTPADGAAVIYLLTRVAGDIGGVRLGDKSEDVMTRWGDPSSVAGPMAFYNAGSWSVFLKLDQNHRVNQLGLGRTTNEAPEGATFYRKTD
jgi:hypothetical protein